MKKIKSIPAKTSTAASTRENFDAGTKDDLPACQSAAAFSCPEMSQEGQAGLKLLSSSPPGFVV